MLLPSATMTHVTVIPTSNTEFPLDSEGRVYHVGAKRGEIANRVLLVGDPQRAELIAEYLDKTSKPVFFRTSARGFTWYTGRYKGTPVTIMAIGMGLSMMDFAVRELRALVDGTMVMIRLGTCGSPHHDARPGSVVVSHSTVRIEQSLNIDYDHPEKAGPWDEKYLVSKPAPASALVCAELESHLAKTATAAKNFVKGTSASCESFYSSQGRVDPNFHDHNDTLIDGVLTVYPDLVCFEMETHQLFHVAKLSKKPILTSGCAIVLMQRKSHEMIDHEVKVTLEKQCGQAILETLHDHKLDASEVLDDATCVWN